MEVKAKLRYLRISPKKTRLVVDVIRGMEVKQALAQLKFIRKRAARPIEKLVKSAMANAANNFDKDPEKMYIKEIRVDQGPTLKRWRPRAFGRAGLIRKRSSHVSLVLAEKEKAEKELKKTIKEKVEKKPEKKVEAKKAEKKEEPKEKKDKKSVNKKN